MREIIEGDYELYDINHTHHIDKRIKMRTGLPKKAHVNFLKRVLTEGLTLEDVQSKSSLCNYLKSITRDGCSLIIYNKYIVVFSKCWVGITLLHLPKEYHKIIDILKQRKKEVNLQ